MKSDFPSSVNLLKKAIALDPKRDLQHNALGRLSADGRDDEAKSHLKEYLKKEPGSVPALHYLANMYASANDMEGAQDVYDQILRDNPNDVLAMFRKGILFLSKGRLDDAGAIGTSLVEKFPNAAEGYKLRGLVAYNKKDYKGSVADMQKALSIVPDPGTHYSLGLGHFAIGEFEQASNQMHKALDIVPDMSLGSCSALYSFSEQAR